MTALIVDVAEGKNNAPAVAPPATVAALKAEVERHVGARVTLSLIYKARRFMSSKTLRRLHLKRP